MDKLSKLEVFTKNIDDLCSFGCEISVSSSKNYYAMWDWDGNTLARANDMDDFISRVTSLDVESIRQAFRAHQAYRDIRK